MDVYRDVPSRRRRKLLPYVQAIHRRWYHATLIENTPFSPANLMESLCRYFKQEPDSYIVPMLRTPSKVTGMDLAMKSYTLEKHLIVEDMRVIIKYCSPHIDLAEEGCFTDTQSLEVAANLSMVDPHYASFLLEVALWMKLLIKMPSLYVNKMQITEECHQLMEASNEDILRKIVDATISLTAFGLRNSMPMPEHIFTETFVRELLTVPMETDDLFAKVFDHMGYDIEDLLEISNTTVPEGTNLMDLEDFGVDMELLSGTFVMGIVLDRFFFTPFGHFLRMIRPMYALPFDFESEINEYANVCEDPEEAFVAFFAPCSSYTLTDLGLEIMGVKATAENYLDIGELIPFDTMKDTIFASPESMAIFVDMARQLSPLVFQGDVPDSVYTFRVRMAEDSTMWVHLQMPDDATLHQLYEEITDAFELIPNDDYSFFHDKTENRFAEYASTKQPTTKGKGKRASSNKTADIPLNALDFAHMQHMVLATFNQSLPFSQVSPTIRFNLERMNEKTPDINLEYPRISRESAAMIRKFNETLDLL